MDLTKMTNEKLVLLNQKCVTKGEVIKKLIEKLYEEKHILQPD